MATAEVSLKPVTDHDVQTKGTMKALVYHGRGKIAWEDKPRPGIQHPGDAIVRLTTSTIAEPICTFLKAIFLRLPMDVFWAMRASASSSR
jgi:hypothetical protein